MSCLFDDTDDTDLVAWLDAQINDPGPGDLTSYDWILVNTSAGKDSQTMMRLVVAMADEAGVPRDRIVAVHADLGTIEWEGTPELAQEQAEHYGLRFITCTREKGDLLQRVLERRAYLDAKGDFDKPAWPSHQMRYCTSDLKRGQIRKVMTALVRELGGPEALGRPARILNCMGQRAQESRDRAKYVPFVYDERASGKGTVRQVWNWYPILQWKLDEVWADIHASGVPYHPIYDAGSPRLSCSLCALASTSSLVFGAKHRPELAARYAEVEVKVRSTMHPKLSMAEIIAMAEAGPVGVVEDWDA